MVSLLLPGAGICEQTETDGEVLLFVVAGQSNVLNWHARAGDLPSESTDAQVGFYYHTGAPPGRDYAEPFNATSRGAWTTLRTQRQEPYVKWEREFFGPEISLSRALIRSGVRRLAVIKVGYFGTNLAEDWAPDSQQGARLYSLLLSQVNTAMSSHPVGVGRLRIAGFFWMQGETDGANESHANRYAANLEAFVSRVRSDLKNSDLPFVLGRVGPVPGGTKYRFQGRVRMAQTDLVRRVSKTAWVDTDDLPRDTDDIHLLAPGVITLGERWAAEWQRITSPGSP